MTTPSARADLAAEMHFFATHLGWPVSIDIPGQRLVMHTGTVLDALRLPHALAEPVAVELSTNLLPGPVWDHDSHWWTFLTEPCRRRDVELPEELRAAQVYAVPRGGQVVVPPVATLTSWRHQPQPGRPLPPWTAVVASARRVVHRGW